jgi:hypothetical protein
MFHCNQITTEEIFSFGLYRGTTHLFTCDMFTITKRWSKSVRLRKKFTFDNKWFLSLDVLKQHTGWFISLGPSQKKSLVFGYNKCKTSRLWHLILYDKANITLNVHVSISRNNGDIKANILEKIFFHDREMKNSISMYKWCIHLTSHLNVAFLGLPNDPPLFLLSLFWLYFIYTGWY